MFKIRSVKFTGHPVLGNLEFDFRGQDGNPVDTVVIAGENGTGKSTLLDALYSIVSHTADQIDYSVAIDLYRVEGNNWYNLLFSDARNGDYRYIKVTNAGNDYGNYHSDKFRADFPTKAIYSDVSINFNSNTISSITSEELDANEGSRRSSESISTEIHQLLVDIQSQDDTDVANFLRENRDKTFDDYQGVERMSRFKQAFHRMFDDARFGGVGTEHGRKTIYFEKKGAMIPIDALSSGEKQIVYRGSFMLRDAHATQGAFVFIDEPEISLHPSWQERIMDYYKSLFTNQAGVQTSQIFCVTHSPFIIHNHRRMNDKVIVLGRNQQGELFIKEKPEYYLCDSIAAVEDAFSFSGFATDTPTVYVEGIIDERYMRRAVEALGYDVTFEFHEIGNNAKGGSRSAGEANLRHACEFLSANRYAVKHAFLFDCDVAKIPDGNEKVLSIRHEQHNNAKNIRKGIENALVLDDIDISDFFRPNETIGDYGELKSNPTLDKSALCNYVCGLDNTKLKKVFANLASVLDVLVEFFGRN